MQGFVSLYFVRDFRKTWRANQNVTLWGRKHLRTKQTKTLCGTTRNYFLLQLLVFAREMIN